MAYCVEADVTARISTLSLAQLTNDTANATTVGTTVLTALIAAADAEIDAILSERYTVPFTTVPPRIRDISVTITAYHAQARRFGVMHVPKDWKDLYAAAVEELKRYASGDQPLPSATDSSDSDIALESPTRVFDFESDSSKASWY